MTVPNAKTPVPQADDPFFGLQNDSEWNALIGTQGDEENYVDGYIAAAIELASAVVEKRMYGERDTLVILYNARHGLELSLKVVVNRLNQMEVTNFRRLWCKPRKRGIFAFYDSDTRTAYGHAARR
jgi:hypothetical protein